MLLWASLAIGTLEGVIALFVPGLSEDELGHFLWWILAGTLLLVAANAYFIYGAARRKNWARIVLLSLAILSLLVLLVSHFMLPAEWSDEDWWSNATFGARAIMDAIAIYWLFTGAGASWYSTEKV